MVGSEHLRLARLHELFYISSGLYVRIVKDKVSSIEPTATAHRTHSIGAPRLRRISTKTDDLRALQLSLGHREMDNTVRHRARL